LKYNTTLSIPDAEQLLHLGRIVHSLIRESYIDSALLTDLCRRLSREFRSSRGM